MGVAHDEDAERRESGIAAQVAFAIGGGGMGAVAVEFDVELLGRGVEVEVHGVAGQPDGDLALEFGHAAGGEDVAVTPDFKGAVAADGQQVDQLLEIGFVGQLGGDGLPDAGRSRAAVGDGADDRFPASAGWEQGPAIDERLLEIGGRQPVEGADPDGAAAAVDDEAVVADADARRGGDVDRAAVIVVRQPGRQCSCVAERGATAAVDEGGPAAGVGVGVGDRVDARVPALQLAGPHGVVDQVECAGGASVGSGQDTMATAEQGLPVALHGRARCR